MLSREDARKQGVSEGGSFFFASIVGQHNVSYVELSEGVEPAQNSRFLEDGFISSGTIGCSQKKI